MVVLDKLLPRLRAGGHRVLIFSQFSMMLDLLSDYLSAKHFPFEMITGSVSGAKRQRAIDRFSRPDSDCFIMLLTTKAGGVGINLTAADTAIIYDSDWNPQNDMQAMARCHRIGQTKQVKIFRLLTNRTYEHQMFHRASLKLGLERAVLLGVTRDGHEDDDEAENNASGRPSQAELDRMLRVGAYDIFEDDGDGETAAGGQASDIDIDALLVRSTSDAPTGLKPEPGAAGAGINNSFSRASFVCSRVNAAAEGAGVDMMDPEFWTKVVGLKQQGVEVQMQELAGREGGRRGRRGRDNVVSYRERREGDVYNEASDGEGGDGDYADIQKGKGKGKAKGQKRDGAVASLNKKQVSGLIKALSSMGAPTCDYDADGDGANAADGDGADGAADAADVLLDVVVRPLSWAHVAARAGIALLPREQQQQAGENGASDANNDAENEDEAKDETKNEAKKASVKRGALPLALVRATGSMLLEQASEQAKEKGLAKAKAKAADEKEEDCADGGSSLAQLDADLNGSKKESKKGSNVLMLGPVQAKSIRESVKFMRQLRAVDGVLTRSAAASKGSDGVKQEEQEEQGKVQAKRSALLLVVSRASKNQDKSQGKSQAKIQGKNQGKSSAINELPAWWKAMGPGIGDSALLLGVAKHGVGQHGFELIEQDSTLPLCSALAAAQAEALVAAESAMEAEVAVKEALTGALFPTQKQCQRQLDYIMQTLAPAPTIVKRKPASTKPKSLPLAHSSAAAAAAAAASKSAQEKRALLYKALQGPLRNDDEKEDAADAADFESPPSSPVKKLSKGSKASQSSYIIARVDLVTGLGADEAVGVMVPNSKGGTSKYSRADLRYDIDRGFLCGPRPVGSAQKKGNAFSMLMTGAGGSGEDSKGKKEGKKTGPATIGKQSGVKQEAGDVAAKPKHAVVLQPVVGSKRANNSANAIQPRSPKAAKTIPVPVAAAAASASPPRSSPSLSPASSHPLDSLLSVGEKKTSEVDNAAAQSQGVKRKQLQGPKAAQQKPKQKSKQKPKQKPKAKPKKTKGNISSFFTKGAGGVGAVAR
jgi:hypothetical protein